MHEKLNAQGVYQIRCFSPSGQIKWESTTPNVVTVGGSNLMLDCAFSGTAPGTAFTGLITADGYGGISQADTMTVKSWTESDCYGLVRPTVAWHSANSGKKAWSMPIVFTSIQDDIVVGCFLLYGSSAGNTVLDTNGVLWSASEFSNGGQSVLAGDSIVVQYATSLVRLTSSINHFSVLISESGHAVGDTAGLSPIYLLDEISNSVSTSVGGLSLAAPSGYTHNQLILNDAFTALSLDASKWHPWIGETAFGRWSNLGSLASPYSGVNCTGAACATSSFNCTYYDPYPYGYSTLSTGDHLVGGNGKLKIIAEPSSFFSVQGYTWACAAISTYGLVEIPVEGGYVQIRAKMPDSRYGAWAALWFMSSVGDEIDLMESGFTSGVINPNQIMATNWHGSGGSQQLIDTGVDLSAAYHTYGMEFLPGVSIKMYLDGALQATYTTSIPTGVTYQLIIDIEVANSTASGFHTVSDIALHPGPFEHNIDNVQIYSLALSP